MKVKSKRRSKHDIYQRNDRRCYRDELASARQFYSIRNYKRVMKCRGVAIGLLVGNNQSEIRMSRLKIEA